jgi:hypothetical protein
MGTKRMINKIDQDSPKGTYFFNTQDNSKYFLEISWIGLKLECVSLSADSDTYPCEVKNLEIGEQPVIRIETKNGRVNQVLGTLIDIIDFEGGLSQKAFKLAAKAHKGQIDLAGVDYLEHVKAVGEDVKKITQDDRIIAVAYLHDILEDTYVTESELSTMFSNDIVEAVKILTKERYEQYQKYIARVKTNAWATIVKIADLNHNADISRIKNPQDKDLVRLDKYIRSIRYLEANNEKIRLSENI